MLHNIKMEHYLNNLLLALLGKDPFRMELEKVKYEYEMTAKKVVQLEGLRYQFEEKMAGTYKELAKTKEEIRGYKMLTENLRQSVADKDAALDDERRDRVETIKRMEDAFREKSEKALADLKEHYEREIVDRHEEYEENMAERDEEIVALRDDLCRTLELLQEANRTVAKDLIAQSLLDKTNNGLEDLYAAMKSGEVEKILMATQYLDWSNHLVRIAQVHLGVLRRKNELVERLHFTEDHRDDNVNFD